MGRSRAIEMRQRMEKARAQGLCIVCRCMPVLGSRSTCNGCSTAAKLRVARIRGYKKEQRLLDETVRSYEAAGDMAISRFAYVEASAQYERALTKIAPLSGVSGESQNGALLRAQDEARLCEKIGDALFYGARPDFATMWFERAFNLCVSVNQESKNLIRLIAHLSNQCWIESQTQEALEYALHKRTLAARMNEALLPFDVSVTGWLLLLGRYAEAEKILPEHPNDFVEDPSIRGYYMLRRGIILATQGRAPEAFSTFDGALDIAKEIPNGYLSAIIWDDYANWATALGRLDIARSCRERALFVARERRIAWRIPYFTLRFASMLISVGDYEHARDLVRDALTFDAATPIIRVLLSIAGVEVARVLDDDVLLKQTLNDEALEFALQSGELERIAPIVSTYTKIAVARGHFRHAKALISRGIAATQQADHAGDLLAIAARYGSRADALVAGDRLRQRTRLPHHSVAQAYLTLWEAYDAQRRRADAEMRERAQHAAKLFARLGRKHQQREALSLLGPVHRVSGVKDHTRTSMVNTLHPSLTTRERQVAELVLRGLSNRAIAQALSIREHTVETHMTSILGRLGLRSRWQIIDRS